MKTCLLVDANSLVFRAYYATIYTRPMVTTSGQPTNAVFGFANMVNKALSIIKPDAVLFAFDSGKKTFRHQQYPEYKGTRKELPQELIDQFQLIRDYLDASNFTRFEIDGFEADDIIGTMVERLQDVSITILTSDRDLLQLINNNTSVLLMKKGISEMDRVDEQVLKQELNLTPPQICDLKGLMGDSSDNIPGIPNVGEKTAVKLLSEYGSLENVLANTEKMKGKLKENIENNFEIARLSKQLATISREVPLDLAMDDLWHQPDFEQMGKFFRQYEMRSLDKMIQELFLNQHQEESENHQLGSFDSSWFIEDIMIVCYLPINNGISADASGVVLSDGSRYCLIEKEKCQDPLFIQWCQSELSKNGYDLKNLLHIMDRWDITINNLKEDIFIMAFLTDTSLTTMDKLKDLWEISVIKDDPLVTAGNFAVKAHQMLKDLAVKLNEKSMYELYETIERPLLSVLYEMEKVGILVDREQLDHIATKTLKQVEDLTSIIYHLAGQEFNINSPKQLGTILFDVLGLKAGTKRSTAVDVLESLLGKHPIVDYLMEYRKYQKLYSTYAQGLKKFIHQDQRIHTVFNQCATQTGRLSATEPNMQNISIRDEDTREIRRVFISSKGYHLLSADYSQIELRVLAHMAQEEAMIKAFQEGFDIHTQTAMDVFQVDSNQVTDLMRRQAKAVNFGIIYGISDFGLSQQLHISRQQASVFIDTYLKTYPQIRRFMDETVAFCQQNGYVKTLFNRRREIPEIFDKVYSVKEFGKRAAMNAPIQGSAADLIKIAMLQIHNQLKTRQLNSRLLLQVHDELVLEVLHQEQDEVEKLVIEQMNHAAKLLVPLQVSTATGNSWYEAK